MKNITATHFYNYAQCPKRIYLNLFGDQSKKLLYSDFMQKKFEDGLIHEKDVIKGKKFIEVAFETFEEGFKKTIELMKKGEELIYQPVIISGNLVGIPDLIQKTKGCSALGDYHYQAIDIKSGKRLREEYKMQICFYSYILSKIQDALPEKGTVINIEKKELVFDIKQEFRNFEKAFECIKKIFQKEDVDTIISSKCNECVWREVCFAHAQQARDLSLIYRMNENARMLLILNGIKNIDDAAVMEIERLSYIKGLGNLSLNKWKVQAQSLVSGKTIMLHNPVFPKKKTELFFDIEGDQEINVDYLYGVLIREDGKEEYKAFTAKKPEDEGKMFKEFCDFIEKQNDFAIYHYTPYEKASLKRLSKKYKISRKTHDKITKNMKDLFTETTKNFVFPLPSYSIKKIAKFLGFNWQSEEGSGTQSMVWYEQWLNTKDEKVLEKLLQYNCDDCRAMLVLKDWMSRHNIEGY